MIAKKIMQESIAILVSITTYRQMEIRSFHLGVNLLGLALCCVLHLKTFLVTIEESHRTKV